MPPKSQNTNNTDTSSKYKTEMKKVLTLTNKAIVSTSLKEKNDLLLSFQELFTPLYDSFEKHQTILRIKNDELAGLRKKLAEAQNQKDTLQRNTAFYSHADKARTIHNENRLIESIKDLEKQILERNPLSHPDKLSETLELPENSDQRLFSLIDLNLQRIEELAYSYKKRLIVVEESQESTEVVLRDYGSINHLLAKVHELEEENEKLKEEEKVFIHDSITKRRKFAKMTPPCARDMITVFKNFIKADKATINTYLDEEFSVNLDDSALDFDNVSADDGFKEEPSHFEASDFGNTTEPEMITPIIENDDLTAKIDAFKNVISSIEATDTKISNEIASIPNHYDNRKYATVSHIDKLAEANEKILTKIHKFSADLDSKNQDVIDISNQIIDMTNERKRLMQFYIRGLGNYKRLTESHIDVIGRQTLNKEILTLLFQLVSSFGNYIFNNPLKKKKKATRHRKGKNSSENKNSNDNDNSNQNANQNPNENNNENQKENENNETQNVNANEEPNESASEAQNENSNEQQNENANEEQNTEVKEEQNDNEKENENPESNSNDQNSDNVQNSNENIISNSNDPDKVSSNSSSTILNSTQNTTNSASGSKTNLLTNSNKNSALGSSQNILNKTSGKNSSLSSLKDVSTNSRNNSAKSSSKNSRINIELSALPILPNNNSGKNSNKSSAKSVLSKAHSSRLASIHSAKCLHQNLGKNSALSSMKHLTANSGKNSAINSTKSLPTRTNSLKTLESSFPVNDTEKTPTNPPETEITTTEQPTNATPEVPPPKDDDLTIFLKSAFEAYIQQIKEENELRSEQLQNKNAEDEKEANESHSRSEHVTADEFQQRLFAVKKKKTKHAKHSANGSLIHTNSNTTSKINVSQTAETETEASTETGNGQTQPTAEPQPSQIDLSVISSSNKYHFTSSRSNSELFLRRPRIEVLQGLAIAAEVAGFTYNVDQKFTDGVSKLARESLRDLRASMERSLQDFGNPFNEQIAQINMSANRILVKQKEAIAIQTDVQPLIEEETQTQQPNLTKQKPGKKK